MAAVDYYGGKSVNDITKFWSDDFDMDLLQLFPDLREKIGPVADAPVWVLGSCANDGMTFAHPTCWNTHSGLSAFFWAEEPPELKRDEHGWVRLEGGFTTNEPLCCLTVLQAIRDCWVHTYTLFLENKECLSMSGKFYNSHFYPIMATRRGWQTLNIEKRLRDVEGWAAQGARNMQAIIESKRLVLGREFPYFRSGGTGQ